MSGGPADRQAADLTADDTWVADVAAIIEHELRQADADYAAGNTVSGEELRQRYGLTPAIPTRLLSDPEPVESGPKRRPGHY